MKTLGYYTTFRQGFSMRYFCYNSINDGDLIRWNNETQDFEAPRIRANFEKAQKRVVQSYDTYETVSIDNSLNKRNTR